MPGEAYRDALATANARIQQLESEARDANIPLVFNRRPFSFPRTLRLVAVATVIAVGVLGIRAFRPNDVVVEPKPLGDASRLPTSLAWFEPAVGTSLPPFTKTVERWGPLTMANGGRPLLVGFVWRRDRSNGGLRVAAWDRATLKLAWVSESIRAPWVSADSDWRFHLASDPVDPKNVVVRNDTGSLISALSRFRESDLA